jgi:hypothetical protein
MLSRRSLSWALGGAALTLAAGEAQASRIQPMQSFDNQPWNAPTGNAAVNSARTRQAVTRAAQANKWTTEVTADGRLLATLFVRGKHTIIVSVVVQPGVFSVGYSSSINMNYQKGTDGKDWIHPNYNVWVRTLVNAIRFELEKG